ncbi:MAG: RNA polymerase-binding protein DksA [Desulfobacteraceae bacterium]|nr:RNA polymerase-binding protein DksA [Desulfobacteraceae bacterium]
MQQEDLYFFKKLLSEQLHELMGLANNTISSLLDDMERASDPLDRATLDIDRSATLRIRDRESKLIRKIKKTLESIYDGTFGICEMCEEEINFERLKARPVTSHCIKCKTIMENMEKAYR